jgi:hypothetical protein
MGRGRRPSIDRDGLPPEPSPDDDGDDDDGPAGGLGDLVPTADPSRFGSVYPVTSDDEPFATGDSPAIPRPWQGIPRVAVVYNLNFVWDAGAEEWQKKTPTEAGNEFVGARLHQDTIGPIPPGASEEITWDDVAFANGVAVDSVHEKIEIQEDGIYAVRSAMRFDDYNDGDPITMSIYSGFLTQIESRDNLKINSQGREDESAAVDSIINLSEGDEIYVEVDSDSDTTIRTYSSPDNSFFTVTKVGDLP